MVIVVIIIIIIVSITISISSIIIIMYYYDHLLLLLLFLLLSLLINLSFVQFFFFFCTPDCSPYSQYFSPCSRHQALKHLLIGASHNHAPSQLALGYKHFLGVDGTRGADCDVSIGMCIPACIRKSSRTYVRMSDCLLACLSVFLPVCLTAIYLYYVCVYVHMGVYLY